MDEPKTVIAAIERLEAKRQRRIDEKIAKGVAVRVPISVVCGGRGEVEAAIARVQMLDSDYFFGSGLPTSAAVPFGRKPVLIGVAVHAAMCDPDLVGAFANTVFQALIAAAAHQACGADAQRIA
jgi:hypothetical protein